MENKNINGAKTKFFTNREKNTLYGKFAGILENNVSIDRFDAVVGYLRASGYFKIRKFLSRMKKVRILVGINTDKYIAEAQRRGLLFYADANRSKEEFLKDVKADMEKAGYTREIEEGMLEFVEDIVSGRIEIRVHPGKKIHAKIYILYPDNFNEHTLNAAAITGSSNLTDNGLGVKSDDERQYEFNVLLNDNEEVCFAKNEFEILWKEAEGGVILPSDIKKTQEETYLASDVTPYELYIKMLIEYFGDRVDYSFEDFYDMPKGFKKMEYQAEAVDEGYKKLMRYDGFFLSDVVGLGKTVIAAMIAKRFSIDNGEKNTKILVVYPPAVEKNWKTTFDRFGLTNAKFITNGSLSKVLDNENFDYWNAEEYDLILVDESHKFRNHNTGMFKLLQDICKCPRINKGKVAGAKKKVMLISATPLNNSPEDLYNQILLFQNPRRSTLDGIVNLTGFFSPKIQEYKKLKSSDKIDVKTLKKLYDEIREKVIKPITIRRTRSDIKSVERYKKDIGAFPEVQKPDKTEYILNETQAVLFADTVSCLTEKLNYGRYQAIANLKSETRNSYYEKAEFVSKSLAYIMKTLLVKRLESSFYAFKRSLKRFCDANKRMIEMFENDRIFIAPDLDVNKFYEEGLDEDEIERRILFAQEDNARNRIFKTDDFVSGFKEKLLADQRILDDLQKRWDEQHDGEDPKLKRFIELLDTKFFDKDRNKGGKLVIFSESAETVEYLKSKISRDDVLDISADNRNRMHRTIEENFDANYDKERKNDYNILLATDVLSEGINLHRSNIIINYDTPWNAIRLMQRIGRVNRIGSEAANIYNYVFYPSAQGNRQIRLIQNSLTKLQAFHTAFGEDSQIYSEEEIIDNVDRLFELGEGEEEINMELQYLEFLRRFKEKNPKEYKRIAGLCLRSRTGRNAMTVEDKNLSQSSLVFLKNNDRNSFYLTGAEAEELTALQAIKYFEAKPDEPKAPRTERHYEQVQKAKLAFENRIRQNFIQNAEVRAAGRQVRSAVNFVRNLRALIDETELLPKVDRLIKMIEWGTITSLAIDLNKMSKQSEKHEITPKDCIERIKELTDKYDGYFVEETEDAKPQTPLIILSESFN